MNWGVLKRFCLSHQLYPWVNEEIKSPDNLIIIFMYLFTILKVHGSEWSNYHKVLKLSLEMSETTTKTLSNMCSWKPRNV